MTHNTDTPQDTPDASPFGPVIHHYRRAQAIEDGVLVDATELAKDAGIRYPVALTRTLWDQYIVPPEPTRGHGQSEAGRLWDVLFMLRMTAGRARGSVFTYQVAFVMGDDQQEMVSIQAHCGPGDDPAPVITLMLPGED